MDNKLNIITIIVLSLCATSASAQSLEFTAGVGSGGAITSFEDDAVEGIDRDELRSIERNSQARFLGDVRYFNESGNGVFGRANFDIGAFVFSDGLDFYTGTLGYARRHRLNDESRPNSINLDVMLGLTAGYAEVYTLSCLLFCDGPTAFDELGDTADGVVLGPTTGVGFTWNIKRFTVGVDGTYSPLFHFADTTRVSHNMGVQARIGFNLDRSKN